MIDPFEPPADDLPPGPGAPVPRGRLDAGGVMLVAIYLIGSLVLIIGINVLGVLGLMAAASQGAPDLQAALQDMLKQVQSGQIPGWFLAASMTLQFPGMLAATWLTAKLVDYIWYRPRGVSGMRPWAYVFALRPTSGLMIVLGLLMGFTTGWLPGWMAGWLREQFPQIGFGTLDVVNHALTEGWWLWRLLVGVWVAFGAALVEELVFRGFIWEALERIPLPPWAVWVASSILFAGYHMDPVQSSALIFTALTLGWLRWTSGSVWPGVVLHAVNNSLGVGMALSGGSDTDIPLYVAVLASGFTLALWGVAMRTGPTGPLHPPEPAGRG